MVHTIGVKYLGLLNVMHNLSSIIDFFEKHGLTFKLRSDQRTAAEVKGNKMAIVSQVNY